MNKLVAALVVGIVVALAVAGWEARAASTARGEAHVADSVAQVAGQHAAGLVTIFRHDTTRVLRSVRTIDTVLEHLIDSAIVHHTDTVMVRVPILVAARDTLRACQALVLTCGEALDASRNEVAALKVAEASWKKAANVSRLFGLVPMPKVTAGVSVIVDSDGRIRYGPGVSLGWTLSLP